ncbi:3-oxoacyl-[acyl-carrier-protein] reductase FabG [Orientia tsutsugamushi str. UT76]|uniref:3-oxoacyl-ACP reductase n=1 Tax=Orientia tsutsugamushi TaxID=784 RepID=A0A2U3QZ07_ORITS|nr:3-oxoacyl-ACP reductase FabG [Orientia tsutsugamushi]KJV88903.1 3-oxoacyl-[acyl-carrier-protein] reductase FabG [Orientia tsutsugamushi str. UT76]SPR06186.1 3-oxoacyl-ACP reductase [Orientia tsutsugamushi]
MLNFANQHVLITGASGSIGKACSKLFHQLGATVIISGTKEEKLAKLKADLTERCIVRKCNILDYQDCNNMIEEIPKLDVLICCAGITNDQLAIKMEVAKFETVISTNLTATFILNKAAIKKMIKNRYGRIINISSVVAISGNQGQSNYCASKAGIIGMSKALALEVASRNITVNVIAPGFIISNMTNLLNEQQKNTILSKIPVNRFGNPNDIATAAAFLASRQAAYISGQTLHVNGGMVMV